MKPVDGLYYMLATEKLRRQMDDLMNRWNVTRQQYNILRILRGAGEDGLPIMKIADRMIEKTPGLTRMIDRMEKQTRVKREHSQVDRRKVFVSITSTGLQLLNDMQADVDQYDATCLDCLNAVEREQLIGVLSKILSQ